ncbi:uncharacterized protein LOC113549346 [Rhopalosiphum maidis]|uniref:uncharacterized protein LOC113549346 n=1 Tax=Rhopalosiphum maidis TaxID=43146 RepID=UPI000EFEA544|nr:uncharacterized protein LOC113549346 [Rhopalosiphum maidis]
MATEKAKSKIGRWVDETMKGKFDNFVGSRKKSSSNTTTKLNNDIPILPDADENIDADLLHSVKPAELHSRVTESAYEDETTRPPINLADIDLGLLFSNMTRKHQLKDVGADERDVGSMIQRHLKLLNIGSENAGENEHRHST